MMELKDQIRLARERKGMTIQDVQVEMGCSLQAIKYWEAGLNVPRPDKLRRLGKLLDVNLSVTGDLSSDTPAIFKEMSTAAIEVARAIDAMPKELREAVITIVNNIRMRR